MRLDLSTSEACTTFPGGAPGAGAGLGIDGANLAYVTLDNFKLRIARSDLANCAECNCKISSKSHSLAGRSLVSVRAATTRKGIVYAVGASLKSDYFQILDAQNTGRTRELAWLASGCFFFVCRKCSSSAPRAEAGPGFLESPTRTMSYDDWAKRRRH